MKNLARFSLLAIALWGGASPVHVAASGKMPTHDEYIDSFYQKPITEQRRLFRELTPEKKYDVYIYGNEVLHPPALYLAEDYALSGAGVVMELRRKIEVESNETIIRDIVSVYYEIFRKHLYGVNGNRELIEVISRKVNNMTGIWKESTKKMLDQIEAEK